MWFPESLRIRRDGFSPLVIRTVAFQNKTATLADETCLELGHIICRIVVMLECVLELGQSSKFLELL
jgi:hypothetical protein